MSVDYSQGAPPPSPPPPPQKKGLGVVGWIAIGCGAIFLLFLIGLFGLGYMGKRFIDKAGKDPAMAAAKLIVQANPDLELVDSNDKDKTLTIRDKKSGETMTVNLEDVKSGRFQFKTDKGTANVDLGGAGTEGGVNITTTDEKGQTSTFTAGAGGSAKLPDWLPVYPGGTAQSAYDATGPDGRSAMVQVTTSDSPEKVMEFYETRLKSAGLEVQKTTMSGGGTNGGMLTGTSSDQKRTANVTVATADGSTQATLTFTEKP